MRQLSGGDVLHGRIRDGRVLGRVRVPRRDRLAESPRCPLHGDVGV